MPLAPDVSATVAVASDGPGRVRFAMPTLHHRWDTLVATVPIEADGPHEVAFTVSAGGAETEGSFDPGARGRRTLDLTPIAETLVPGAVVAIELEGGRFGAPQVELHGFDNPARAPRRLLVLAPHPDDAEIAAFGLYARHTSTVVTITAGNYGADVFEHLLPGDPERARRYRLKGDVRTLDSVTAPLLGDVPPERALNLGYFDGRLAAMRARPRDPIAPLANEVADVAAYRRVRGSRLGLASAPSPSWQSLVADLEAILAQVRPDAVVAPHPLIDDHPDHQMTTLALAEASRGTQRLAVFLYANHIHGDRHPYGPMNTATTVPSCGTRVPFPTGLVSYELDALLQARKLLAVEWMHDLRPAPGMRDDTPLAEAQRAQWARAVRSNELFYTTDAAGLDRLAATFDRFTRPR